MADQPTPSHHPQYEIATLAGGCFWCTEAIFKRLKGVITVTPGYSGGEVANPTYEQVSSGRSGHAEAIQILLDPKIINYQKLLDVFWAVHDPTTPDRQGNDVGPQYRSAIFYHSEAQKESAIKSIETLDASGHYTDSIVTEVVPYRHFYEAEQEHRDYYDSNRSNAYCRVVIDPKIRQLFNDFKADIKPEVDDG